MPEIFPVTSRTIIWPCAALVAGCLLLAGCFRTPRPPTDSVPSMAPTVPASVSPTSSGRLDALVVGGDRPAKVALPRGLNPNVPAPLLMLLHGYGSSGDEEEAYVRIAAAAAMSGVIYLHPDG